MAIFKERVRTVQGSAGVKIGMELLYEENFVSALKKGAVIIEMWDGPTGERLHYSEVTNLIVLDAGLVAAALFKGDLTSGISMLAMGTGATGNLLSPDAPQVGQRMLNNEIARKAFSSTTYRTAEGVAVSYRTNIVDYTTTFGEGEAVGTLNEMALMVPYSTNPATKNPLDNGPSNYDASIDVEGFDLIVNYLTFAVISKPATAVVQITWRLTH